MYSYDEAVISQGIIDQAKRAIFFMDIFTFVCQPLTLFFSLQILLDAKFKKLSARSFLLATFENFLHFSIFVANVLILGQFNTNYLKKYEDPV